MKDAFRSCSVKLTTRFIEITWSGQASKLNDIKCFGFMMYISCHPLEDPSLRIPVVPYDMKRGVELKQQLLIPVLLITNEM